MTLEKWEQYVSRWKAERAANKGRPLKLQAYDAQQVGALVQGFRLELDVIATPDDILAWHHQALVAPWSIQREHRMRANGEA